MGCHLDCCVAMGSSVVCSLKLARLLSHREQNGPGQGKKAVVCHRCDRYVETEQSAEAQKNHRPVTQPCRLVQSSGVLVRCSFL